MKSEFFYLHYFARYGLLKKSVNAFGAAARSSIARRVNFYFWIVGAFSRIASHISNVFVFTWCSLLHCPNMESGCFFYYYMRDGTRRYYIHHNINNKSYFQMLIKRLYKRSKFYHSLFSVITIPCNLYVNEKQQKNQNIYRIKFRIPWLKIVSIYLFILPKLGTRCLLLILIIWQLKFPIDGTL